MGIKLISTDFDGTLFAEFEDPPVPARLQHLIARLQDQGVKWVINTGRDLSSLMETLGRAHLPIKPDHLVLVEREIYTHRESEYVEHRAWNEVCHRAHEELFSKVRSEVPRLRAWVEERFSATLYEDLYSPFCLIAARSEDADAIHEFLMDYCRGVAKLTVVRNDVYSRLSHEDFNKGTALTEVARGLGIKPAEIFAAGDHLNDLPMLSREHAWWLAAPSNAIPPIKKLVREQKGFVSQLSHGHGVAEGLEFHLKDPANR